MRKLLLLFFTFFNLIAAQQISLKQDTIYCSNYFINNQSIQEDNSGKLHISFTAQSSSNHLTREVLYAKQESNSFKVFHVSAGHKEDINSSLNIDFNGNAHITYLGKDTSNFFQIKYSNNSAGSFSEPLYITSSQVNKICPVSAIDNNGIIHFVYFTNSYSDNNIFYRTYNTKKSILSGEKLLAQGETSTGEDDADICVDKKGKIHIVVKTGSSSGGEIKYFNNTDGILKEVQTGLTDLVLTPKLMINGTTQILYKNVTDNRLYSISYLKYSFSKPKVITPSNHKPYGLKNLSVDNNGNVFGIYTNTDSLNNKEFYLFRSKGIFFTEPVKIHEIPDEINCNSLSIKARGDGIILILNTSNTKSSAENSYSLILNTGFVFGNALIKIENDSIHFGDVSIGSSSTKSLEINNNGSTQLKINPLRISHSAFKVDIPDTLFIEPDSSKEIIIEFYPSDTLQIDYEFTLISNANNSKELPFFLSGKGVGIPEMFVSKDTLIIYKESEQLDSIMVINNGTALLRIDSLYSPGKILYSEKNNLQLNPGDSAYFKILMNLRKKEYLKNFSDSILIYSNDFYDSVKTIYVQSNHFYSEITSESSEINQFELYQNYPNPFNPQTTLSFMLSIPAYVTLSVYDALAREISTLIEEYLPSGQHNVMFNGDELSTGIYYYKLRVKSSEKKIPDYVEVRKMLLVK